MGEPARRLQPVATLDEIAADPGAADALSNGQVADLMVRALAVVGTLQARVLRQAVMDSAELRARERMLTRAEVAQRIGRSVAWIEKNMRVLPARRAMADGFGWREADINEWIRNAPRY